MITDRMTPRAGTATQRRRPALKLAGLQRSELGAPAPTPARQAPRPRASRRPTRFEGGEIPSQIIRNHESRPSCSLQVRAPCRHSEGSLVIGTGWRRAGGRDMAKVELRLHAWSCRLRHSIPAAPKAFSNCPRAARKWPGASAVSFMSKQPTKAEVRMLAGRGHQHDLGDLDGSLERLSRRRQCLGPVSV